MAEALGHLLTPLYAGPVALRRRLYDAGWLKATRLPVPVISVGNLTTGGSGKSPAVAMIAELLLSRGRRPAIVSRGYRGSHRGPATVVSSGEGPLMEASVAGDEPVMLAAALRGVPVIVSRRRRDGGALAVERFGADCVILDDGFQHRALARDLDLLLVSGGHPFGNGRLLPAGPLREPISAMSRAGALMLTGGGAAGDRAVEPFRLAAARYCPLTPVFSARLRPVGLVEAATGRSLPLGELAGKAAVCFAGIAFPQRFFDTVAGCGARVAGAHPFPDHHAFSRGDLEAIRASAARAGATWILATEKDLARMSAADRSRLPGLHALRVTMQVEEAAAFAGLLLERLR